MANFYGIEILETEIIETRSRSAARPTGFYSKGSAGRPALTACCGQNIIPGQKRLFRSDPGTPHLSILDWQTYGGREQGEPPGPDHL